MIKYNNSQGQSTIEFLLTFMFALGFLFLFVNVSVNYSAGYLVHYATFMASRVYMTYDTAGGGSAAASDNQAKQRALDTLKRFKVSALGVPVGGVNNCCNSEVAGFYINSAYNPVGNPLYAGAVTVFKKPLSYFRAIAGDTEIRLVSESFLGKEPVRYECWERTCQAINLAILGNPGSCNAGSAENKDITVFDNGC
jgi:hypothetical protein